MKINVYAIERRFDILIENIEYLTFNYVHCLDEQINENEVSYLDKCHMRQSEIDAMYDCGIIGYTMSCALYDYVDGLISRHLSTPEHISKYTDRYAPFEI